MARFSTAGVDVDGHAGQHDVVRADGDLPFDVVRRRPPALFERGPVAQYRSCGCKLVAVGSDVHDRGESRVIDLAVVALEIVLDDDLPVRRRVVRHPPIEAEPRDIDANLGYELRERAERLGERWRLEIGVHEHHGSPGVDLDRAQAELARVEVGLPIRSRRRPEAAVELVGPGVVGALQGSLVAGPETDARAPVTADVDESPQLIVVVADEDDRYLPVLARQEVTGLGELFAAREVLPGQRRRAGAARPLPRPDRCTTTRE